MYTAYRTHSHFFFMSPILFEHLNPKVWSFFFWLKASILCPHSKSLVQFPEMSVLATKRFVFCASAHSMTIPPGPPGHSYLSSLEQKMQQKKMPTKCLKSSCMVHPKKIRDSKPKNQVGNIPKTNVHPSQWRFSI